MTHMASYKKWNRMIAEYFISGLPLGSTVYLSIDEDVIVNIGKRLTSSIIPDDDSFNDFLSAIRKECVINQEIKLNKISGEESDGLPLCIAFLGALILAAYWMAEDEDVAVNNYFTRVRQVFGLSVDEAGRPKGLLPTGVEEYLWEKWNTWLVLNEYLPSAEQGESNMSRYINYPVSQTILRKADKDDLKP